MAHDLTLYQGERSSSSWRVRLALTFKAVPYKGVLIDLSRGEASTDSYLKLNPMAQIPCLVVDGYALSESMAILEWLEETYPTPPLLPKAPLARAQVRQMALAIVAGTQPLQSGGVLRRHSDDKIEQRKFAQYWIKRGLESFEVLSLRTRGDFCFGNTITMADLMLLPQVANAVRMEVDIFHLNGIQKIVENFKKAPVYSASSPPPGN